MKDDKIITMKRIHSQSADDASHGGISPARMKSNPVLMMIPNLQGVNVWSMTAEPDHGLGVWISVAKRTKETVKQKEKTNKQVNWPLRTKKNYKSRQTVRKKT